MKDFFVVETAMPVENTEELQRTMTRSQDDTNKIDHHCDNEDPTMQALRVVLVVVVLLIVATGTTLLLLLIEHDTFSLLGKERGSFVLDFPKKHHLRSNQAALLLRRQLPFGEFTRTSYTDNEEEQTDQDSSTSSVLVHKEIMVGWWNGHPSSDDFSSVLLSSSDEDVPDLAPPPRRRQLLDTSKQQVVSTRSWVFESN
jgi:hypothetical protein